MITAVAATHSRRPCRRWECLRSISTLSTSHMAFVVQQDQVLLSELSATAGRAAAHLPPLLAQVEGQAKERLLRPKLHIRTPCPPRGLLIAVLLPRGTALIGHAHGHLGVPRDVQLRVQCRAPCLLPQPVGDLREQSQGCWHSVATAYDSLPCLLQFPHCRHHDT